MRGNIIDGRANGLEPLEEVALDLAGRDPGVSGGLEVVDDEDVHSELRRALGVGIKPTQRTAGAMDEQDGGMPAAAGGRVFVDGDGALVVLERGHQGLDNAARRAVAAVPHSPVRSAAAPRA